MPQTSSLLTGVLAVVVLITILIYRFREVCLTRQTRPPMPPDEVEKLMARVEPLFDTNPEEAQRILDDALEPYQQREEEERRTLWAQAPYDPIATRRLRDLIMDDLETHRYALKEMSTSSISSPTPPDVLAEIKAAIDSSERDLAKVNAWLK
jgi:hypothetical protein